MTSANGHAPRRWLVVLSIAAHVVAALALSACLSLWLDEAYSLVTTGRDIGHAFHQSTHFQLHPPLYFVTLTLWRQIDDSLFLARLFSVLCTTLTLIGAARLSKKWFPDTHPAWLLGSMAVNPFLLYAATEARVAGFVVLISMLLLLLFSDGYLAGERRRGSRWLYALVSVAALYTNYYLGFLLLANACGLLLAKRWRPLRDYVLAMVLVAVCIAPMLPTILAQTSTHATHNAASFTLRHAATFVPLRIQLYVWPVDDLFPRWVRWPVLLVFTATLAGVLLTHLRNVTARTAVACTVALVFGIVTLVVGFTTTGRQLVAPKHTAGLFVPAQLMVFSILSTTRGGLSRRLLPAWMLVTAALTAATLIAEYRHLAKPGDWARAADYVESHEAPDQPIVLFNAEAAVPFGYYYSGGNALVPIPKAEDFEVYDIYEFVLHDASEIDAALGEVPGDHERVWVVTNYEGQAMWMGVDFHLDVLESYLASGYAVERDERFFGSRVRLMRKKEHEQTPTLP